MSFGLIQILVFWVPLGVGLVGILFVLAGILGILTGKERSMASLFNGVFVIILAVGLRYGIDYVLKLLGV